MCRIFNWCWIQNSNSNLAEVMVTILISTFIKELNNFRWRFWGLYWMYCTGVTVLVYFLWLSCQSWCQIALTISGQLLHPSSWGWKWWTVSLYLHHSSLYSLLHINNINWLIFMEKPVLEKSGVYPFRGESNI